MLKKILDVTGWAGVALVTAAVVIRFTRPELQGLYSGLAVAGLACTLLFLGGQWREIGRAFSTRQARYGTLASASVLVMLAILVAVNYLATRQSKRWDLTAAQQFTLSDQTRRILAGLDSPVQVRVFAREDDFARFRDRLSGYEHGSRQVSVEYIDLDRRPALARQYQVQSYGTIVFEHDGRIERTTATGEQELTNTLIRTVQGAELNVYFVQGHGEKDPVSADRDGFNGIAQALRSDNFEVETIVLAQHASVPADAALLVIAGPATDYFPAEVDLLRDYLRRGGKALFLLDPPEDDRADLPNLTALLREWAIEVGRNVVVDASGMGQLIGTDASVPVAASYPSHPVTEGFNLLTAFPLARSVDPIAGGVEDRFAQTIVETSPRSWAETDIRGLLTSGEVSLDEDQGDRPGPISIGAAVSVPAEQPEAAEGTGDPGEEEAAGRDAAAEDEEAPAPPESRVVVIGDSDFAANFALGIQGNRDLFMNAVNWLAQQEDMIAIRPRDPEDRRLTLTAAQQQWIMFLTILIVPGLILAAGIQTWWRRR